MALYRNSWTIIPSIISLLLQFHFLFTLCYGRTSWSSFNG